MHFLWYETTQKNDVYIDDEEENVNDGLVVNFNSLSGRDINLIFYYYLINIILFLFSIILFYLFTNMK